MKKKSFIMLLCAVMVMTSVAFGTIAFLTDQSGVKNTFTVGNVDITVDETVVDPNGKPEYPGGTNPDGTPVNPDEKPNRTEEGNAYDLMPGESYTKDPTMTVKAKSKDSYVRMLVTITKASELEAVFTQLQTMYPGKFANGFLPEEHVDWDSTNWPCSGMSKDEANNAYVLEFRYPDVVAGNETEDTVLPALFTELTVPGEITTAQLQTLADLEIEVVGQAIQATGFETVDDAWAAFDKQTEAEAALQPSEPSEP